MELNEIPHGRTLTDDVDDCRVPPGQFAMWWLGQQSFILKLGQAVLYLDPFLTPLPERRVEPLLSAAEIRNATLVLGSHDHLDHIDRAHWPGLAAASPEARFIVPSLLREGLSRDLGLDVGRLLGVDDGLSVEHAGVRVTGVAAAHELLDRDPATGCFPYLCYVIEGNGCTLLHAGDTCVYEGLLTKLRRWRFDAVMLPINGRDARRLRANCLGNMTYQEAADLAGGLSPALTIPAHYDMFAFNSADVNEFIDYMDVKYPHLPTRIFQYGQRFLGRKSR